MGGVRGTGGPSLCMQCPEETAFSMRAWKKVTCRIHNNIGRLQVLACNGPILLRRKVRLREDQDLPRTTQPERCGQVPGSSL